MAQYVNPLDELRFGIKSLFEFVSGELHIPVSLTKIELAAAAGEIKSVRISSRYHFSLRMALEWAESLGVTIDWESAEAEARSEGAQMAQSGVAL